ncbi:MAG TPA: 3D domain-containing protein [Acidobacteriota bacterium]|nr:3D domain-containing protein [Acidobacteriota bacterium]
MQEVTFSENGSGERWSRRNIFRFFTFLCALATGIHLRALDGAGESVPLGGAPCSKPKIALEDPRLDFFATAYCESGETRSGVQASPGIVAADPRVLPLGSVIHVDVPRYRGVYKVMDTGRLVKGRVIDIYMPNHDLAMEFGRRKAKVMVLRYGFSGSYRTPAYLEPATE